MPTNTLRVGVQGLKRIPPVAAAIRHAHHRDLDPRDVLLASYPKSGSTWVRFMLGQLISSQEVTWDNVGNVVPMVNRSRHAKTRLPGGGRLIKTHDQCLSAYKTPSRRAIYLVRDGRDVVVSKYRHQMAEGTFDGTFDRFLDRFLAGRVDRFGSWASHTCSWSTTSSPPTVKCVRYEDVLADPTGTLEELCQFIGLEVERTTIQDVVDDNARGRMRMKEADSDYLAKRRVRDIPFVSISGSSWRDSFTPGQLDRFMSASGEALERLGYAP